MIRKITLTTGQWSDMSLDEICKTAESMGYDGLELNFRKNIIDIEKAAISKSYCKSIISTLNKHKLDCFAISSHAIGQCVGDLYDTRLDAFVPDKHKGKPKDIKKWAFDTMMMVPQALDNMKCKISTSFMGSPIWRYLYHFPPTSECIVEEGYNKIIETFIPILDEFEKHDTFFALEVHPAQIAFDYYSAEKLMMMFPHKALKINFDPSHLFWQGIDPEVFIKDFSEHIVHVHMKDVKIKRNGKAGILGSHLQFGDSRRGWDFRSLGRGDIDFEEIIRALDEIEYRGPLSVEWEDNGMDRMQGASESIEFIKRIEIKNSNQRFDSVIKYNS